MFINTLKQFLRSTTFLTAAVAIVFATAAVTSVDVRADDDDGDSSSSFRIDRASWSDRRDRITVRGSGDRRQDVTVTNADTGALVGTDEISRDGWEVRESIRGNDPVPCRIRATQSDGQSAERDVSNAPADCDDGGGQPPPAAQCDDGIDNDNDGLIDFPVDPGCTDANDDDEFNAPPPVAQCDDGIDNDGDGLIDFPADPGCVDANDNDEFNAPPQAAQCADGIDNDGDGLIDFPADPGCANANDNDEFNAPPQPIPNVSINSTSQNGIPGAPVSEQPLTGLAGYMLFSANDLGMHCGDFDTRISSVLPPFQVMHTQVIQRGSNPDILTPV